MRRFLSISLMFALALPLAACGGDVTAPDRRAVGVYELQTVNGDGLPWLAMQVESDKIEIMSASLSLEADGSFVDRATIRVTEGGVEQIFDDVYTGTFEMSGSGAMLTVSGYQPYYVGIDGDQLILLMGDFELLYQK